MHLQENTLYDLDLVVKVTHNVVQYPLNHMTYAPAKFEVAMSNSLGEDAFTRKYIICRLVGSNYRLGGGGHTLQIGGAHITDWGGTHKFF